MFFKGTQTGGTKLVKIYSKPVLFEMHECNKFTFYLLLVKTYSSKFLYNNDHIIHSEQSSVVQINIPSQYYHTHLPPKGGSIEREHCKYV